MDSKNLKEALLSLTRADSLGRHRDTWDGVGRVLLTDVRSEANDRTITIEDVAQALTQLYPKSDVEPRSENIILIFWDGKDIIKGARSTRPPLRTT